MVVAEQDDEWQDGKRYFLPESMARIDANPVPEEGPLEDQRRAARAEGPAGSSFKDRSGSQGLTEPEQVRIPTVNRRGDHIQGSRTTRRARGGRPRLPARAGATVWLRSWRALGAMVALPVLLVGPAILGARAADPPKTVLVLSQSPGGDATARIALVVADPDTGGTAQAYLRSASIAVSGVRLIAEPILETELGTVQGGAVVSFTIDGQPQPADGFTVPAGPREAVVGLTVTGIARYGNFSTNVLAVTSGGVQTLTHLGFSRTPTPALAFLGSVNGAVSRTSDTPTFDQPFQVESRADVAITDARLSVSVLDPRGRQTTVMLRLDGTTVPNGADLGAIAAFDNKVVSVSLELPETGTYVGELVLDYAHKREVTTLTIERTHVPPTVAVEGIATVPSEALPLVGTEVTVLAMLHETASRIVDLDRPTVTLDRVAGEQHTQADYTSAEVTPVLPGDAAYSLAPDGYLPIRIAIHDLKGTGTFSGHLLVTRSGSGTVDAPFTVQQRLPWYLAALLIALGVAVSYVARAYYGKAQPRLLRQRTILRQQQRLADLSRGQVAPDADEANVLHHLDQRLARLLDDVVAGRLDDPTPLIDEISGKIDLIPSWINARVRIESLEPPDLRDELRPRLSAVGDLLGRDESNVADAKAAVGGLPAAINTALKERLAGKIAEMKLDVAGIGGELPASTAARITSALDQVSAEVTGDAVDAALVQFAAVRRDYAHDLATALAASLAGATQAPPGTEAAWRQAVDAAQSSLTRAATEPDPDVAMATYRTAYTTYLSTLVTGLLSVVPQQQGVPDAWSAARDDLGAANTALALGDLAAAKAAYDKAVAGMPKGASRRLGGTVVPLQAVDARSPSGLDARPLAAGTAQGLVVSGTRRRIAAIEHTMWLTELGFAVVVGVVAVMLGMNALYTGQPTWGSGQDVVTALLWGLGLHQVAGTALDLSNIKNTIAGLASPTAGG